MYNEVRNLKKSNRPLRYFAEKFNAEKHEPTESNLERKLDPHKKKKMNEVKTECKSIIKD